MSVDFFGHEVEKKFPIKIFQKRKYFFRIDIPSGRINEGEGKAVTTGRTDILNIMLERALKDLNIEFLFTHCKSPELSS